MSGWHTKNLGDAMLAIEPLLELESMFEALYGKDGGKQQAALFIRHESEGRLQCDAMIYFSPAATKLAELVSADPCARPARDSLSLFAGNDACWQALFP